MIVPEHNSYKLDPYLRRRSTHVYQSIIVETGNELEPTDPQNEERDQFSTAIQMPGSWKIFVLTTSVTNYFCCGCNLTRITSSLKNYSINSPVNWAVEKLGGEKIAGIKKKLASSVADWILDLTTTVSHLFRSDFINATLTYLIVLLCGVVSTFVFLRHPDIRSVMRKKSKEVGFVWTILLFIPTFFSTVSCRLWLFVESESQRLVKRENKRPAEEIIDNANEIVDDDGVEEELSTKFKDWTLTALWLETVLEAKPQAVIQTMFLIERTLAMSNTTIFDFLALPMLLSLWSMYTVTNSIYEMVVLNFTDDTGVFGKLYGNTYTAMSTLAPALVISVMRKLASSMMEQFLLTLASLGLYYVIFEIFYQFTYLFCSLSSTEFKKHATFVKVYTVILALIFSSCVTVWGVTNATPTTLKVEVITGVFILFLILNGLSCFKAFDFVEECFRLKNVKIDEAWNKFKVRKSTGSH